MKNGFIVTRYLTFNRSFIIKILHLTSEPTCLILSDQHMVLYLLFTHATSSIIIISLVVGFLLTITYVLFLKRQHRYERRHFGAVIEDLRKKEEEEKELLFTQLLQWRG